MSSTPDTKPYVPFKCVVTSDWKAISMQLYEVIRSYQPKVVNLDTKRMETLKSFVEYNLATAKEEYEVCMASSSTLRALYLEGMIVAYNTVLQDCAGFQEDLT